MRKIHLFTTILCLLFLQSAQSQTSASSKDYDVGSISISLVMPSVDEVEGFSASHLSKLENRILRMLSSYGLSGNGFDANFVVYPKIEILDEDEIPGMETMYSTEIELNLFVKQIDNNILFGSYAKEAKGISAKKGQGIKNAIRKLPTKSRDLEAFMEEVKGRITTYYEQKCGDIMAEADRYSLTKDYDKAIATLMTIPSEVSDCYNKAQEKAVDYFKTYSNQQCAEFLQKAAAEEANRNFEGALYYLSMIDPESDCKTKSGERIRQLSGKVDVEDKKNWDFLMRAYQDEVDLEKARINGVVEIAKSFYNRTQPTVHLTYKSLF